MFSFDENLKEMMDLRSIDIAKLSTKLSLSDPSKIYSWLNGKRLPNSESLIQLATIFSCSTDFLLGLSDDTKFCKYNINSSFEKRLKSIMNKSNVTEYKMEKELKLNPSHFHYWFSLKASPKIKTLIKLSNYFGVSVDYLLGRDLED